MTVVRPLAMVSVALGLVLAVAAPISTAEAGLFDFLFGGGRQERPPPAPRPVPQQVPRRAAPTPGNAVPSSPSIGQQRTYCVRTCDGYYFAIGFVRNKAQLAAHQQMCSSSCGDAPMKLFTAPMEGAVANKLSGPTPAIERAIDDKGGLYTALPTAYAFREADNTACACKSTANGLPQIPISIDPTLRSGDIIVTQDGLKVFRGGSTGGPHQDQDFVGLTNAKALSSVVRQQMLSLEGRIAQ